MEERIEAYFKRELSDSEKEQFEQDLKANAELAESVAFYLLVKNAAQKDAENRTIKLAERHTEWQTLNVDKSEPLAKQIAYFAAAAVILIALGLGWYFLNSRIETREQMANAYIQENFTTLNVQMGGSTDSLQQAINEFNKGVYAKSRILLKNILARDPENTEAQKIAGIVSLKMKNYDEAIIYFQKLGNRKDLYSNPGKFYEAIAHLQRGLPLDKKAADNLLHEVIDGNLEGKDEAIKWLK